MRGIRDTALQLADDPELLLLLATSLALALLVVLLLVACGLICSWFCTRLRQKNCCRRADVRSQSLLLAPSDHYDYLPIVPQSNYTHAMQKLLKRQQIVEKRCDESRRFCEKLHFSPSTKNTNTSPAPLRRRMSVHETNGSTTMYAKRARSISIGTQTASAKSGDAHDSGPIRLRLSRTKELSPSNRRRPVRSWMGLADSDDVEVGGSTVIVHRFMPVILPPLADQPLKTIDNSRKQQPRKTLAVLEKRGKRFLETFI